MPTTTIGERHRGPAERDWADVRTGRLIPVHQVVARYDNKRLEVLRMPLEGRGETLPVFSASGPLASPPSRSTRGWRRRCESA